MIDDGERLYMAAGFPTYHVMAIDPAGHGNVTDTNVLWHREEAHCYVPSPVVVDGCVFVANDDGIAHCFDADSGDHVWRTRLGRHYSASLVTAGGLVYFLSDEGITSVIRPGPVPDIVAESAIGEFCAASPAISQGLLLIRGEEHLYCISQ
jgi:outer membrane protein assembly factor BamB